jgi:hypothetical protein
MVHRMVRVKELAEQSKDVPVYTRDAKALFLVLGGVDFGLLVETIKGVSLLQPDSLSTSCRDISSAEPTCFFDVMTVKRTT